MPTTPHIERHFTSTEMVRDIVTGETLLALFLFGFFKGQFTGISPLRSGAQTVLVGGLAAGVAFGLARLIG